MTVAGEEYVPLGGTDFSAVINKIKVAKPEIIFNTLNGDSNVSFFKQMAAAGLPPSKLPVMSFSIAEQEAKAMGPSLVEGSYAAWNYFQTLADPVNKKFVAAYQGEVRRRFAGRRSDGARLSRRLCLGGGGEESRQLRHRQGAQSGGEAGAGRTSGWAKPSSPPIKASCRPRTSGELDPDGQFKILWQSERPIVPEPYDPLSFPGKKCVTALDSKIDTP